MGGLHIMSGKVKRSCVRAACLGLACAAPSLMTDGTMAARDRGEAPVAIHVKVVSAPPGGVAGVGFAEDFESGFALGSGCTQNGWTCGPAPGGFDIVNIPTEPTFGGFSSQDQATGSGNGLREMRSPQFTLETGEISADILINDASNLWQWLAINTATGVVNTRISFNTNGSITVLQPPAGGPPCAGGAFAVTTGTWTPGVTMRIGIEVQPGNVLIVRKNGVQIFSGQDISQACAAANPNVGIGQMSNYNSNAGFTSTMTVDNISGAAPTDPCTLPLPPCPADIAPSGGDGAMNILDLLEVINTWGQTQIPPGTGPRPPTDCAPLPNGDCLVNINDLLAVVNNWGACPP